VSCISRLAETAWNRNRDCRACSEVENDIGRRAGRAGYGVAVGLAAIL